MRTPTTTCVRNDGAYRTQSQTWDRLVQPYVKSTAILTCPDDQFLSSVDVANNAIGQRRHQAFLHNAFLMTAGRGPQAQPTAASYAQIPYPSITISLFERDNLHGVGGDWNWCGGQRRQQWWAYRHQAGSMPLYGWPCKSLPWCGRSAHNHYAILAGYRCWPKRAPDSAIRFTGIGTTFSRRHEGIDATCPGALKQPGSVTGILGQSNVRNTKGVT